METDDEVDNDREVVVTNDAGAESDEEAPTLVDTSGIYMTRKIPITILTGFLGSGKTTLLNYILREKHGLKIAIIENEFGAGLSIESMIAKSGVDGSNISNFIELSNGCICCTIKDDLLLTLEQLLLYKDKFDYIIIETTGVANPGPIVSALWADEQLDCNLILDGVVCVVDSYNIESYLSSTDESINASTQICLADRILLNKSDMIDTLQLNKVRNLIQSINSYADIATSAFSRVPLDFVLNTHSYSINSNVSDMIIEPPGRSTLSTTVLNIADFMSKCQPCAPLSSNKSNNVRSQLRLELLTNQSQHFAVNSMKTHYVNLQGSFHLKLLQACLDSLLYNNNNIASNHNKSNNNYNNDDDRHDHNDVNGAAVVTSTSNISTDTSTVVFCATTDMKIFRMKGIVHIHQCTNLFILQAVHEIFDLQESSYSTGGTGDATDGSNPIVIIGKNLDCDLIKDKLMSCIA